MNHCHPTIIDNINDVRNGMLLLWQIQRYLGKVVAFLPVYTHHYQACNLDLSSTQLPNEYMTSQDVSNTLPERSYILHDLKPQGPEPTPERHLIIPQGHPIRVSSQDWPPDILFDTIYASAAITMWGAGSHFKDHVKSGWTENFYGGTPVDKHDGGKSHMKEEQAQATQQQQQQSESRAKRYELRRGRQVTEPDTLDIIMASQFLVHPHWAFRMPTEQPEDTSESVQSRVQEWLETSQQFETHIDTQ